MGCTGRIEAIRDMTHHQTLEQDPALALWHLDTLLTHAPMGFAFFDRELRFVRINDQLAEINGYSVAAHLGRTVAEILPTLAPALHEVAARILETGQPVLDYEFTGETARAPGVARYWNGSWYPVRDDRDKIIGFGSVVEDITERKQTEAALRFTNESLELSVKASKVMLFQQDLELRYRWILNTRADLDASEVIGKRDADLMERAEDAARAEAMKREVLRSGVGKRGDVVVHIHNVARHYDLLVEPMWDAAGLISGVTCAAIDITERKLEEAAQREIDRNYRALADASSEIPYRMSADWSTMLPLDGRSFFYELRPPARRLGMAGSVPSARRACPRQAVGERCDCPERPFGAGASRPAPRWLH